LGVSGKPVRLAHEITAAVIIKIVVLALLWFAFVRHREVVVDAQRTVQAFGLDHSNRKGDGRGE
jgi:hypothetical protein